MQQSCAAHGRPHPLTHSPTHLCNQNPAAAARAYADAYEQKMLAEQQRDQLEETVQEQAPKVAALGRIALVDGSLHMQSAAKHLQVRPIDLKNILVEYGWIYRRAGNKNWLGHPYLDLLLLQLSHLQKANRQGSGLGGLKV